MVRADVAREMLARLGRVEDIERFARDLGVDRENGEGVAGAGRPRIPRFLLTVNIP